MKYNNPILPGFYPDPSICRVKDDYYLVTSSFEYFPGVPIFHSKDLMNWKQIGHCLTRESQLPLKEIRSSGGIYAPTLRTNQGRFYMVTTNVNYGGNFFVYTDDPQGEWSDPIYINQEGIDPSLFFDEDGKVYFCSNGGTKEDKRDGIYLSEIDIHSGKRLTEPYFIWAGTGGRYPEAPHLYHIGTYYYLLIAEGGTEYGHMVTIARSKTPYGPYEACPHNPILSNRDHSKTIVQGTGHGDLFCDHHGNWWIVFLAFRTLHRFLPYHHLGRETFLAPVRWNEEGWPIVYDGQPIEEVMDCERVLPPQVKDKQEREDFEQDNLSFAWNFLRNPEETSWSLKERKGFLRLHGNKWTLDDSNNPAFLGRRQTSFTCTYETLLQFNPNKNEEAGITVFMNEHHHYDLRVKGSQSNEEERFIEFVKTIGDLKVTQNKIKIDTHEVKLKISCSTEKYDFYYGMNDVEIFIGSGLTKYLSSEVAGGFTGVYIALYASGNGQTSTSPADFDYFLIEYHS